MDFEGLDMDFERFIMDFERPCSIDSNLLFFILIFLLLFHDDRYLEIRERILGHRTRTGDSSILFFILVFLLLFY